MNKLFYKISKFFWTKPEDGSLTKKEQKLKYWLWGRLSYISSRQRDKDIDPAEHASLDEEESWILSELFGFYFPHDARRLFLLLMAGEGFVSLIKCRYLKDAFDQMIFDKTLKLSDVLQIIAYRQDRLPCGSDIIRLVEDVVFRTQYFDTETRKSLAKQAYLSTDTGLLDLRDIDNSVKQLYSWFKDDVDVMRKMSFCGSFAARQQCLKLATLEQLQSYCEDKGCLEGCYSGSDDSFAKVIRCRSFMTKEKEIAFFDEQLLLWHDKADACVVIRKYGLHESVHSKLLRSERYDDYIKAYREYLAVRKG